MERQLLYVFTGCLLARFWQHWKSSSWLKAWNTHLSCDILCIWRFLQTCPTWCRHPTYQAARAHVRKFVPHGLPLSISPQLKQPRGRTRILGPNSQQLEGILCSFPRIHSSYLLGTTENSSSPQPQRFITLVQLHMASLKPAAFLTLKSELNSCPSKRNK